MANPKKPNYRLFVDQLNALVAATHVTSPDHALRLEPLDPAYPDRRIPVAKWDASQQRWELPDAEA